MAKKLINWRTKGMNRDTSPSVFSPEFAFENRNIRLSTNEGNTQMSWVNERGTQLIGLKINPTPYIKDESSIHYDTEIHGTTIGTAIINHQLVLFTVSEDKNYIYSLKKNGSLFEGKILFSGDLNFNSKYPIETLVVFESELIQKVYWTDNYNSVRVINVAPYADNKTAYYNSNSFEFIPEVLLSTVNVTKINGSGEFPAGVIQYAFTYYNKYMQESNIFYVTPLQYICHSNRGGSPEEVIANSFKLKLSQPDPNFDYLRIYSILRTSKNTTPLVKRVQDIKIETYINKDENDGTESLVAKAITFTDTGTQGETIDPTELLYKNSNKIVVKTIEQKDNTLFLGNIKAESNTLPEEVVTYINSIREGKKVKELKSIDSFPNEDGIYIKSTVKSKLFSLVSSEETPYLFNIDLSGFKNGEYYRIGIQFQHNTGVWSEPLWITDYQVKQKAYIDRVKDGVNTNIYVHIPQIQVLIKNANIYKILRDNGYEKRRLLMVQPTASDRTILCQGIANTTLYQNNKRYLESTASDSTGSTSSGRADYSSLGTLYGQSSWIFRPYPVSPADYQKNTGNKKDYKAPDGGSYICNEGVLTDFRTMGPVEYLPIPKFRSVEVGATLSDNIKTYTSAFCIDSNLITLHSPEIELDKSLYSINDFSNVIIHNIGKVPFSVTYGDIDIQTETTTIDDATGFIHKSLKTEGDAALISGLFYEDYIVDDADSKPTYNKWKYMKSPVLYPVYMWQKNGSLNNDVKRDGQSAKLLKKKISNYHYAEDTIYYDDKDIKEVSLEDAGIFYSEEVSLLKINGKNYMGNIDTMVSSEVEDFKYFTGSPITRNYKPSFLQSPMWRLGDITKSKDNEEEVTDGMYYWEYSNDDKKYTWIKKHDSTIGDYVKNLCASKEQIRIKYKSTPHLVAMLEVSKNPNDTSIFQKANNASLPICDVVKTYDADALYGGTLPDALKTNMWIPISEPISNHRSGEITSNRGDTWYQRYDCLKTYPFTSEDVNQVVDIASFMVETHINIDGRYDRNRGQINNLNMSPKNFNLINPVYSQLDNFFNYKILDEDDYKNTVYPNQITWSKTKESGAITDAWTNITLASTLEMDGDKGCINKLVNLNNQLICFQDSGISQILYNENAQISTTAGVPIELANSGKVQGKRYYTNTIGCSNKWSVVQTPAGIYFMDSNDKGIYLFNGELKNITMVGGLNTWAKQNIPSAGVEWNPVDFKNFVSYYDPQNQEVLFINRKEALAFSEKFSCFTSFYDYENAPYFCTLDDTSLWIKKDGTDSITKLWQHQAGEYCNFFGNNKGYSMTLIGNQEPTTDKIFTNLEFRACIEGEGATITETVTVNGEDKSIPRYSPTLPFDSLEVWDEYQHGILKLSDRYGHVRFTHGNADGNASLNRKFRMWRCDIPRDNAPVDDITENMMGIKRFKVRPLDRIRNPWIYLKLEKKAVKEGSFLSKVEIHDLIGTYFS